MYHLLKPFVTSKSRITLWLQFGYTCKCSSQWSTRKPALDHRKAFLGLVLWSRMTTTFDGCKREIIGIRPCESGKTGVEEQMMLISTVKVLMEWKQHYNTRRRKANPATWPSTDHGRQSSTMEKLRDLIHACVPKNGTVKSWSPLYTRAR